MDHAAENILQQHSGFARIFWRVDQRAGRKLTWVLGCGLSGDRRLCGILEGSRDLRVDTAGRWPRKIVAWGPNDKRRFCAVMLYKAPFTIV